MKMIAEEWKEEWIHEDTEWEEISEELTADLPQLHIFEARQQIDKW